ncbi:hypothetical protein LSG31_17520 [Fodinisporobacter ferrooxydans]|uniref:Uncharacterized protein n=1 Tax=Fodinisporobacter ferrooxydans TaxID=2901836 RepID=A0ABY4CGX1_9BACL|nr:hypothetical protein LSG31_17520 [Alicyclobacillaceae bacterium MYW30-H2]
MSPELEAKIIFSIKRLRELMEEGSISDNEYRRLLWNYTSKLQSLMDQETFEQLLQKAFHE